MRIMLTLLATATVICVLLLVGAQLASAGSADAPELTDASGDCAVPYGNEYLDVAAAWVDNEDADSFDVHLQLAAWRAEIAEGSGYTVQFGHQGVSWGIIATYSSVVGEGWTFATGVANEELAEGFEEAPGAFDAATATITVTFPKAIFPHDDPSDTTLREFTAMTADLRPAYPFFAAEPTGVDSNGRWVVCDNATGTGAYSFAAGTHSTAHSAPSAEPGAASAAAIEGEPAAASSAGADDAAAPGSNDTPLGALVAIAALAIAARRR